MILAHVNGTIEAVTVVKSDTTSDTVIKLSSNAKRKPRVKISKSDSKQRLFDDFDSAERWVINSNLERCK